MILKFYEKDTFILLVDTRKLLKIIIDKIKNI